MLTGIIPESCPPCPGIRTVAEHFSPRAESDRLSQIFAERDVVIPMRQTPHGAAAPCMIARTVEEQGLLA